MLMIGRLFALLTHPQPRRKVASASASASASAHLDSVRSPLLIGECECRIAVLLYCCIAGKYNDPLFATKLHFARLIVSVRHLQLRTFHYYWHTPAVLPFLSFPHYTALPPSHQPLEPRCHVLDEYCLPVLSKPADT